MTLLKISENAETRSGRGKVLNGMSAQNRTDRINCAVIELEELCGHIQCRSDEPVSRSAVSRWENQEQEQQHNTGKKLHPAIKPQIAGSTPQQEAEDPDADQRPEQSSPEFRIQSIFDRDRKNDHKSDCHR